MKRDDIRQKVMTETADYLSKTGDEILEVASNAFVIPTETDDGEEIYIKVTFSIPKGARGSDGYDGYEEALLWKIEKQEREQRAKETAEAKRKKMERDKERRQRVRAEREAKLAKAKDLID